MGKEYTAKLEKDKFSLKIGLNFMLPLDVTDKTIISLKIYTILSLDSISLKRHLMSWVFILAM